MSMAYQASLLQKALHPCTIFKMEDYSMPHVVTTIGYTPPMP